MTAPTKEGFISLLPRIREAARRLGYAVCLHGSLERDFDIVAVAWVVGASDTDSVARAIKRAAGGVRWRVFDNRSKPFGRVGYAFDWDKGNFHNQDYCDLSVIPPTGGPA